MSDTIRRLNQMWPVMRFSICHWTLHLVTHAVKASNVVHVQRCHRDKKRRDGPKALCGKWDKGDSLLYDDRSIGRFDGYSPQI
jgi:hypothetical protein